MNVLVLLINLVEAMMLTIQSTMNSTTFPMLTIELDCRTVVSTPEEDSVNDYVPGISSKIKEALELQNVPENLNTVNAGTHQKIKGNNDDMLGFTLSYINQDNSPTFSRMAKKQETISYYDIMTHKVHPCKCSGTIRWVHQKCLQRWVEEKQKDNSSRPVQCPHCKTEYMIILPRMGIVVGVLHELNEIIKLFCPFLVGGMAVVILYWTSVTYGAITVLQVMGYNDGIRLLERTHPLALIIGLPSIPVSLILSQFFRWDDMILSCIGKEPYTRRQNIEDSSSFLNSSSNSSTPTSGARIICTALLLPTVSVIIGKVFKSIESNLIKTILGGLSFIAVKGAIKIILQHSEFVRKRHKKILDYTESNLFEFINNQANLSISDASSSGVGSNTSMELLVIENLMQM